jgi:hypothetical protein
MIGEHLPSFAAPFTTVTRQHSAWSHPDGDHVGNRSIYNTASTPPGISPDRPAHHHLGRHPDPESSSSTAMVISSRRPRPPGNGQPGRHQPRYPAASSPPRGR